MPEMIAKIDTAEASLLINRLCKHFSHKIDAHWANGTGRLTFSIGECRLEASEGLLTLVCQSPTREELDELGDVVASHLIRFARGQVDQVPWQATAA